MFDTAGGLDDVVSAAPGVGGVRGVSLSDVLAAVDPGPRPSVHEVSAGIDAAVVLREQIDALEGRLLLAVEHSRRAAHACETALLDDGDLELRRASATRRRELAERAFVADLATALRMTEAQASHLVDTARTLTDVAVHSSRRGESSGVTLVELCRGRFSAAHARAMADTLAELPDAEARARVESAALPSAARTTPTQFRSRLRRARDLAHPRPIAERHRQAAAKRAVYLDPAADGMAWLSACVPAHVAHAAFDRLTAAARTARDGGDPRSAPQLRADALADLLLAPIDASRPGAAQLGSERLGTAGVDDGATDGRGTVPGLADIARLITPTVRVTVPVMALLGGDAPADLDGHGPIDADTAARLTAQAPSLRRLLVDPVDGRVLAIDPGTYTVPAALRTFLRARDTTCRFPGCTRSATRCDVDHVTAWADGGTTTAGNLAHLCRHHHVLKHQSRWTVEPRPDGTLVWTSPTGRVHHDRILGLDHVITHHSATDRAATDRAATDRAATDRAATDRAATDHAANGDAANGRAPNGRAPNGSAPNGSGSDVSRPADAGLPESRAARARGAEPPGPGRPPST